MLRLAEDARAFRMDSGRCAGLYAEIHGGRRLLAILKDALETHLEELGYTPADEFTRWRNRGWLETERNRNTKKVRINQTSIHMIMFTESGLIAAMEEA